MSARGAGVSQKRKKKPTLTGNCIPSASQNGREAQHASAMDRNLVNLFLELTVVSDLRKLVDHVYVNKLTEPSVIFTSFVLISRDSGVLER